MPLLQCYSSIYYVVFEKIHVYLEFVDPLQTNCIGDVMVSILDPSVIDRGFLSNQGI